MSHLQRAAANDPHAGAVFRKLQTAAREAGAAERRKITTDEYLVRHALESFLARLNQTPHGQDFVLKGGILLAAYGIRRPTKDVDAEAVSTDVTPENLTQVAKDVATVRAQDGVVFDTETITVEEIREDAEYTGLRLRVKVYIATAVQTVAWDVSTGDPIVPQARMLEVPRVLGSPVKLLGYAPETILAEKGVTILQRGTTSTRWRDYVDIVAVSRAYPLDDEELVRAVKAVAAHRRVALQRAAPLLVGYGALGQRKWEAWRTKAGVSALCEDSLDDQLRLVCEIMDPVLETASNRPA
ncbi:nucleotidyl transferase AbiEii/AbiGii toxin family protein [Aquipuribacter sp. MA13-6]|uniref:nucleotidyl transferase AbiEii/AbiGii toxin family protein n=1 Tax=unclassified Aquipuribacter TaxID=2635084 RepID=UPI003EEA5F09